MLKLTRIDQNIRWFYSTFSCVQLKAHHKGLKLPVKWSISVSGRISGSAVYNWYLPWILRTGSVQNSYCLTSDPSHVIKGYCFPGLKNHLKSLTQTAEQKEEREREMIGDMSCDLSRLMRFLGCFKLLKRKKNRLSLKQNLPSEREAQEGWNGIATFMGLCHHDILGQSCLLEVNQKASSSCS